jgi:tellurite resistance protein
VTFFGFRVHYRPIGHGVFHCERCGGDRPFQHLAGRRWFHLLLVPVISVANAGEHIRCAICDTRYRVEVLALPTITQMQTALSAGVRAAAVAMLRASGGGGERSRRRAIDAIRKAGLADYQDPSLDADLTASGESAHPGRDLARPLNSLAVQLANPAREWFLAEVVRIGLADGPLSDDERSAAQDVAAQLGMTPAQARGVITMTEEAAAA